MALPGGGKTEIGRRSLQYSLNFLMLIADWNTFVLPFALIFVLQSSRSVGAIEAGSRLQLP